MTRLLPLLTLFIVASSARAGAADPGLTPPPADAGAAAWTAFSDNLVRALKTEHEGLRCSALQHVVAYGERVDVRRARFEVTRLFRDHADPRVRMLALSALTQIDDRWVTDFLRRSARFEKDPRLARILRHAARHSEERTS